MPGDRDPFRWVPLAAILVLAWLALFPITSVDAYYHVAVGKRILDEGAIPSRGVGSATFGTAPWHDNEWGFQLIAALIGRAERDRDGVVVLTGGGTVGLIVFRALCLAATLGLLSAQMRLGGVSSLTRAVALCLAAFLTFGNLFWDVRPQILSYLAFAAIGYLLIKDRRGAAWARWAILGVIAVWANVHGAFIIGVVLVGVEATGDLLDGVLSRSQDPDARRRGLRLLLIAALAFLAACLNPHGYRQVLHPFLYMLSPEIHAANADWERPDLLHLPLLVLTAVLAGVALAAHGRPRWAGPLRVVAFAALFMTAIRHLPILALVLVPTAAAAVAGAARRGGWRRHLDPTGPGWEKPAVRAGAAALLVGAIIALAGAKFIDVVPRFEERMVRTMPERAGRFLAREGIQGNGFNTYRFGGLIMFRMYPQERVFMDGRNDLYGGFRQEVYDRILNTRSGWRQAWADAVTRYRVGWLLLDGSEPLLTALRGDPDWLALDDGRWPVVDRRPGGEEIVLLLKNTSDNVRKLPALEALSRGAQ